MGPASGPPCGNPSHPLVRSQLASRLATWVPRPYWRTTSATDRGVGCRAEFCVIHYYAHDDDPLLLDLESLEHPFGAHLGNPDKFCAGAARLFLDGGAPV